VVKGSGHTARALLADFSARARVRLLGSGYILSKCQSGSEYPPCTDLTQLVILSSRSEICAFRFARSSFNTVGSDHHVSVYHASMDGLLPTKISLIPIQLSGNSPSLHSIVSCVFDGLCIFFVTFDPHCCDCIDCQSFVPPSHFHFIESHRLCVSFHG
jgi:hypothetical protein